MISLPPCAGPLHPLNDPCAHCRLPRLDHRVDGRPNTAGCVGFEPREVTARLAG